MSTNTALDQIKARVEGHSPTPWHHQPWGGQNQNGDYSGGDVYDENGENVAPEVMDADGALIAAAPKLLAALEAVGGIVDELDAIEERNIHPGNVNAGRLANAIRKAITEALR